MARKGTGISDKVHSLIPECVAHRVCIASVAAIALVGCDMLSVYLKDSVGMNAENKLICEHGAAAFRCLAVQKD